MPLLQAVKNRLTNIADLVNNRGKMTTIFENIFNIYNNFLKFKTIAILL